MSKRLILILALAFVVGITMTAYAEVQNVKVSGDITVKGVARNNFDLAKPVDKTIYYSDFQDKGRDIISITRVRIDADLTDNVMATVRLLNERTWNGEGSDTATTANRNVGYNSTVSTERGLDLNLAYVTLKEFLYSPLTLAIGRQELKFGNGLVVGDPDTNIYSRATNLGEGDLSARKSFDALRATLDYNPLVLDVIYAKIQEGAQNLNDDVDLSGVNASYALNKNTTLEAFMFNKVTGSDYRTANGVFNLDANDATSVPNLNLGHQPDIVNTIGVRAVDKTLKNLSLDGQLAYQFGRYNPKFDPNARYSTGNLPDAPAAKFTRRSAMAAQLKATYDLKDVAKISKYSPIVSAGYTYLSGANRYQNPKKAYTGWDPMFEDQTEGHIMNAIFANTNAHRMSLGAKAKVTDDITANLDYVAAWFAKRYPENCKAILSGIPGTSLTNGGRVFYLKSKGLYVGQEIDATLTYDYTEDVQFSLLGGILVPGSNIRDYDHSQTKSNKANATELIGSMKVTF